MINKALLRLTLDELNHKILSMTISDTRSDGTLVPHPAACGRGSTTPTIMFIGEALGQEEEIQRSPFVGPAGKVLNSLLHESGLFSIPHYITNVVKIRPTNGLRNRTPTQDEVDFWEPFIEKEIELLQPKILVGLGKIASLWLLGWMVEDTVSMKELHGNMNVDAYIRHGCTPIKIMPSYHPAATIYQHGLRSVMLDDFINLRKYLA